MIKRSYRSAAIMICVLCLAPLDIYAQTESVGSAGQVDAGNSSSGHDVAGPKDSPQKSDQAPGVFHWQELKNQFGWEIRFPKDWEAWGHGTDTPDAEADDQPEINGPRGCMESGARCGGFQVIFPHYDYCKLSPRAFLLGGGSGAKIFTQGEIRVGDSLGYEVVSLDKDGPVRVIALKRDGMLLTITYSENDRDPNAIKLPSDWKFASIFETILSTFTFIPSSKTFPPCE